jgi:uncharacterized membrane protein YbhN (UPF0104 family)
LTAVGDRQASADPARSLPAATKWRLFASARAARTSRRTGDLVEMAGAVVGLTLLGLWAIPPRSFDVSLSSFAASSPQWLQSTWIALYFLALVPPLAIAVAAAIRRRWHVLFQVVLAATVAYVVVTVASRLLGAPGPHSTSPLPSGPGVWPAVTLSIVGAANAATWAEITLPFRRVGVRLLAAAAVAAVLAGRASPTAAVASILVAIAAAAAARFAAGTTAGWIEPDDVRRLTAALGVPLRSCEEAGQRLHGERVLHATGIAGEPLLVKVYGRDAAESRSVARAWRSVWYRDGASPLAVARPPGVQEEALVTLLAASRGVPVWDVAAVGKPDRTAEILVLHARGTRVADSAQPADDLVGGSWTTLDQLHAAGLAHLALAPRSLVWRPEGDVALTDFADAVVAPSPEQRNTDDAQLLVTLATICGADAAIGDSVRVIGAERVAALAAYLQPAALSYELRRATRAARLDVDELREATVAAAAITPPELARLRRVSLWGLAQTALLLLAAAAILPALAGLDVQSLRDSLSTASIGMLVIAFAVAQTPRVAQAVSTLGSVPARLPFGPVYALQLATSFMNLALPSAAARMALTVRFFQRQGVAAATAVASGLIDSLFGNVIQGLLLALLLILSPAGLDEVPSGSTSTGGASTSHPLLLAILVLVVVAIVAVVAIGRIRRPLVARIRAWWPEVRASLQPLRNRHKLAQLVLGNLAAELLFASALALTAHAFGAGQVSLVDALLVNLGSSLVTLVVPIPGGIGVAEATLIVGLELVGVDDATAFGITIAYRAFTFYLPPIWGWFAMRWLEKRKYL